ncbi:MAG TPA: cupin domain-containing protein [Candidatus Limnocylindrales bacterium]|nr:cupin domain-containing protein [Candidatus Limnocylindrales bacterium]
MTIRLEFNRIAPGVEIGPHRHGVETIVFLAGGELVFEHGEDMARQLVVRAGDVLYEAPSELHRVRNEGSADALALLAALEQDGRSSWRLGEMLRRWQEPGEPVRRRSGARVQEAAGIRRRFLVEPGDFGSVTFTVTEVEVEPGAADAWHVHPGAEHALVVFEGRGSIRVGDVEETLEPLKGIRVLPGRPHRVVNDSRLLLRYFVCASPGTDPTIDRAPVDAPPRRLDA